MPYAGYKYLERLTDDGSGANVLGIFDLTYRPSVSVSSNQILAVDSTHDDAISLGPVGSIPRPVWAGGAAAFWGDSTLQSTHRALGVTTGALATHASNDTNFTVLVVWSPSNAVMPAQSAGVSWNENVADFDGPFLTFEVMDTNKLRIRKRDDALTLLSTCVSTNDIVFKQWQSAVFTSAAEVFKIYGPDMTEWASADYSSLGVTTLGIFALGGRVNTNASVSLYTSLPFGGGIKLVVVWDGALTAAEILEAQEYVQSVYIDTPQVSVSSPSVLSITEFGAVSVTPCAAAIQAAIDWAEASGGTVKVPAGYWFVETPLVIGTTGVVLCGDGSGADDETGERARGASVLKSILGAGQDLITINSRGTTIRDLCLYGDTAGNTRSLLTYQRVDVDNPATGLALAHVTFRGIEGEPIIGMRMPGSPEANADVAVFTDVLFRSCTSAVDFANRQSVEFRFYGLDFFDCDSGFVMHLGGGIHIYGGTTSGPDFRLFDFRGDTVGIAENNCLFSVHDFKFDANNSANNIIATNEDATGLFAERGLLYLTGVHMPFADENTAPAINLEGGWMISMVGNLLIPCDTASGLIRMKPADASSGRPYLFVTGNQVLNNVPISDWFTSDSDLDYEVTGNKRFVGAAYRRGETLPRSGVGV